MRTGKKPVAAAVCASATGAGRKNQIVNPRISVVIPTHGQRFLGRTLAGLARQSNTAFEVIVVENGRNVAATRKWVEEYGPHLQVRYHYDPKTGLNRARNTGIALARGAVVALLDDDCRPADSWVEALLEAHARHDAAGTVGGRVCLDFEQSPDNWLAGPFLQFLGSVDWSPVARPLSRGEWLVGANLSFRKAIWDAAGGFREGFGMVGRSGPQLGNDEVEFIQRVVQLGARPWYVPEASVSHRISTRRTTIEWFEWRAYGQGRSDVALRRIRQPQVEGPGLNGALREAASRFLVERARRCPASLHGQWALRYRDNLLRCRLAQLHGMLDAIQSSSRRFSACAAAPDAYLRGVAAIDDQLHAQPEADAHLLFELVGHRLGEGGAAPDAWLSELAGMRDRIVSRTTESAAAAPLWGPGR